MGRVTKISDAPLPDATALLIKTPDGRNHVLAEGLNTKQTLFIQYFLLCNNATEAALKAGYAKRSAAVQASALLRHPKIEAAIAAERTRVAKKMLAKFDVTRERITSEIANLAFANMADYYTAGPDGEPLLNFKDLTRAQTAALQEITVEEFMDGRSDRRKVRRVKFKLADKTKNLELLCRLQGLLIEEHQVHHSGQVSIIGAIMKEIDAEAREIVPIEHQPD